MIQIRQIWGKFNNRWNRIRFHCIRGIQWNKEFMIVIILPAAVVLHLRETTCTCMLSLYKYEGAAVCTNPTVNFLWDEVCFQKSVVCCSFFFGTHPSLAHSGSAASKWGCKEQTPCNTSVLTVGHNKCCASTVMSKLYFTKTNLQPRQGNKLWWYKMCCIDRTNVSIFTTCFLSWATLMVLNHCIDYLA